MALNAADNNDAVMQAVRKVTTIATLPEVTARIVATVEDPKSTASQLHKIVSHDPALVTRILKVVNSAFYGLPGQIGSIERAIVLLGLNAVKNIAVAASLGQLFRGVRLCDGFTAKDLWTHCIAVGVASRDICKQMKLPFADEAFLAGMIHDVGILISLQLHPEKLREVCDLAKGRTLDFCQAERQLIGMDHQQLGKALAELWKFPKSCQIVAGHHHRNNGMSDDNRQLLGVVYVADTLVCQGTDAGFNLTAISQQIQPVDLAELQIDPAAVLKTGERLKELVNSASMLMAA